MPERYSNPASTTLSGNGGGITSGDTSLIVADGSTFPSGGSFRILIGTEIILVGARSTNTLSGLVRGAEGTTAASHTDGDDVENILTAGSLRALVRGARAPVAADFSWVNQSGATLDTEDDILAVSKTLAASGSISGQFCSRPSTAPWSVTMTVALRPGGGGSSTACGLGFRDSAGGKLVVADFFAELGTLRFDHLASATSFGANAAGGISLLGVPMPMTLTLGDDATNIYFDLLVDGLHAVRLYSEGRTSYLGAAPDQVGFFVFDNTLASGSSVASLLSYQAN